MASPSVSSLSRFPLISSVVPEAMSSGTSAIDPVTSELAQRIRGMQRSRDWDGAGARAVRKSACEAAIILLGMVRGRFPYPIVSPSVRGAVMLTWRFPEYSVSAFVANSDLNTIQCQIEGPEYSSQSCIKDSSGLVQALEELSNRS